MNKYLGVVLVSLVLFTFSDLIFHRSGGDEFMGEGMEVASSEIRSTTELAENLKELGISGISDDIIDTIDKDRAETADDVVYSVVGTMLSWAGAPDYDFDTCTMTPKNKTVYSFDVEVFDVSNMYTDFLNGVKYIGDGELDFTNIKESDGVLGGRHVTFDWDGESYELNLKDNADWFDMHAVEQLNKLISKRGLKKRLYYTTDEYQEAIIFYRDKEWAAKFENMMLKKLY